VLDGVYLTLLIGPLVLPLPAPLPLTEALESVQVTAGRDSSGFQIAFTLGKLSPLQTMLAIGTLDPMVTRVVVIATMGGVPNVICDGVVTNHEIAPSNEPGQSKLTLTGSDLSALMDLTEIKLAYYAMPDAAILELMLAKYAMFGIVPVVIPPLADSPRNPTDGSISQTSTDLSFIRQLTSNCGYTFYVEPGPAPLTSIAYFGPDVRLPIPQPALSVNSDWATNVDSLSFSLNGLSKQTSVITILDPIEHKYPIPLPLPSIDLLNPPLGARPNLPARLRFADDVSNLTAEAALQRAFGLMREGANAVSGTGSLSVARYGSILRSRQLVGVRGAGVTYDGMYYVESVTHNIKRGEYKQSFTLARDGVVSQTPVVMT
jgi:hypothetical protein